MKDEQLGSIAEFWRNLAQQMRHGDTRKVVVERAEEDVTALLAEVERLRTEVATTQIMVRRLASSDDDTGVVADLRAGWAICGLCRASVLIPEHISEPFPHKDHCPVVLARAILAKER